MYACWAAPTDLKPSASRDESMRTFRCRSGPLASLELCRASDRRTMLCAIAAAALTTAGRGPAARAYPALSKMPAGPVPAPLDYPEGEADAAPLATTVLFDDFTGAANSAPDVALWQIDTVNQGGTQTYTTNTANVRLDGQSHLVIEAIREQLR